MGVRRVNILGTKFTLLRAYEPEENWPAGHGTVWWWEGSKVGDISTRNYPGPLPESSVERVRLVEAHQHRCWETAYAAILAEYPELSEFQRDSGKIVVFDEEGKF